MDAPVSQPECRHACAGRSPAWLAVDLIVGLAEAHTARGLRKMHVSMPKISLFADYLRKITGDEYALATPILVTDGIDVFFEGDDELVRLLDGQRAARQVVEPYLSELVPWADDLTGAYRPPVLRSDLVEIDPRFNSGRMSFRRNRVPLFAVVGPLVAGEPLAEVAAGYDLTADEVALVDIHKEWLSQAA